MDRRKFLLGVSATAVAAAVPAIASPAVDVVWNVSHTGIIVGKFDLATREEIMADIQAVLRVWAESEPARASVRIYSAAWDARLLQRMPPMEIVFGDDR